MEGTQHRGRGGHFRRGGGSEAGSSGEHRGRGRGGHHRGRGKRDHYRGRGRGGPPADFRRGPEENDENKEHFEDEVPDMFPRRKLESNWDRYEASEKEEQNEDVPTQRGTDYHVLLSSAGDSFTQFRFSEEKDWETDSLATNQMSAVFVDLPALAQSLQELPLHQRLNLEAELVQVTTPAELPAVTILSKADTKSAAVLKPSTPGQKGVSSGPGVSCPLKPVQSSTTSNPSAQVVNAPVDDVDTELDLLLNLQQPNTEVLAESPNSSTMEEGTLSPEQRDEEEKDKEVKEFKEDVKEQGSNTKNNPTKQELTEEDLEDWLDSMIS
ncbi:cell death regulator Aven [Chanos chanos]|uniref:Cell death regulator Aven n=1 Tax=Chanos chanos TaxID=29144 RepID=A0A6J2V9R3_CHACN|nr:cell death regulator Aven [Chanos chanos]